ncbi:MAG: ATP-binding protein [Cytophagales bacterium]|nr:ATP-binding protein [Cytophagales bacterium]
MFNFFNPSEVADKLERQKAEALKWILLSVFLLMVVLIVQSFFTEQEWTASDYFLLIGQAFVVSVLFILRKHGLIIAGTTFSIGSVVIMTIVINLFDQDTVFTKYNEEFYLCLFVLVFISLFSTRKVLIVAAGIFFISSIRVSFYLQSTFSDQVGLLREVQIFYSFTLINISIILYFATKFSDQALERARRDADIKEKQNRELSEARKKLEESELLYRSIVNNLIGGFYKINADGIIELVSPSATKIIGFSEQELVGQPLNSFFVNPEEAQLLLDKTREDGKVEGYETLSKTKHRGDLVMETNATVVQSANGDYEGVEGLFYDVSEKRKMEKELEAYRHNLEELVEQKTIDLKRTQSQLIQAEKMASLGVMTAGVAHEINNPLNFIKGSFVGLKNYLKGEKDKEVSLLLNALETGVTRASDIVEGLNQFSASTEDNNERCEIHEVLDNCLTILRREIEAGIEVQKQYSVGNLEVMGNKQDLHQLFLNLLTNAIQAIETHGKITISTYPKNDHAVIEIKDDGEGIEANLIPKIMDPFFTTRDPGKGTGLGLSIAYTIIQDHQGEINFMSERNVGTTATVRLLIDP